MCEGASESSITSRTVQSQREWIYADRGMPQVNPRKQFVTDIIALIKSFQINGQDIVLMMDANEGQGHGSASDDIALACGLKDAHSLTCDLTTPPATYHRGSEKIDFILISPRVALSVRAAILALQDGYLSDHRSLIVDLDATQLFSSKTSPIILAPTHRHLTSTNPRAVNVYVKHFLTFIETQCIESRIADLLHQSNLGHWSDRQVVEWEAIDLLLDHGQTAAENKCPKRKSGSLPWSPDLDRAGRTVQYWRLRMREFTTRLTNHSTLERLANSLEITEEHKQW